MSNAGRPRKPTELKKMQGTYRKDRDYGEVEAEIVSEIPPPPNSLNAMAKREWEVVSRWLFDNNLLAQTDLSLLAIYCTEMARYWELDKVIKKHQKIAFSTPKLPPAPIKPEIPEDASDKERKRIEKQYRSDRFDYQASIVEMREEQTFHQKSFRELTSLQAISSQKARDYGIQFGFTPAARTKIKPAEKKAKSGLDKLLERKNGRV